jgi:hypothetical protein
MVARGALVGRRARQAQHLAHDMSRRLGALFVGATDRTKGVRWLAKTKLAEHYSLATESYSKSLALI